MSPEDREAWIDRLIVPPSYEAVSAILDRVEALEAELAARAAPPQRRPRPMVEHTKGKLGFREEDDLTIWCGDLFIAETGDTVEGLEGDCPAAAANARRLVACWNACEAFTTEAIEGGIVMRCYEESFTLDGEGDDSPRPPVVRERRAPGFTQGDHTDELPAIPGSEDSAWPRCRLQAD